MLATIKRKSLVALISILNMGIILFVISESTGQRVESNLFSAFFESFTLVLIFSIVYIAPFYIFLGIPISIFIDKLLNNINRYKNLLSATAYILFGTIVSISFSFIFNIAPIYSDLLSVDVLMHSFLLYVYPSIVFWLLDYLMNKRSF